MNNRATALPARVRQWMLAAMVLLLSVTPAIAGDTITYSYDARGRLVQVSHSGTATNNGVSASYTYDSADNRTNVTVGGVAGALTLSPTTLPNGSVGSSYSKTITASGGTSPYTYTVSSGTLPAGLTLSSGGVLSGTPSTAGTKTFTVKATDSAGKTGTQSYTVTISAVTITLSPTTLPSATVGSGYSQTITASGGTSPYTYTVSSGTLPTGLTLSSGGLLSGAASAPGTYSFTVQATDHASNTGSQSYSITISNGGVILTLSPTTLPNGTVGAAYGQTITASGGTSPYTFSISAGSLPAGLGLTSGGLISGTPTAQGTFNVTIKATDSASPSNTGTQAYSLVINTGVIANSWSQTISACGTANVDVVSQLSDSDPDGDQISVSGVSNVTKGSATYSGTVVTYTTTFSTGTGSLTYTITDGHGSSASNTMSFHISGGVCP